MIHPGASSDAQTEEGLERSRALVLCLSANAAGNEWAKLEAATFRFRDPLNSERRFIPLRLDDSPIAGSLAQFLYVNWHPEARATEYPKLLQACRPPRRHVVATAVSPESIVKLQYNERTWSIAFNEDGTHALTGSRDGTVQLWDLADGRCMHKLEGHREVVYDVAFSADQRLALSASHDKSVRVWDLESGKCTRVLKGHVNEVWKAIWSADSCRALSGSNDDTIRLWDVATGQCLRAFKGHTGHIRALAWAEDQRRMLSGSWDNTVRLWDTHTGECLRVYSGHTHSVMAVAWTPDNSRALTGSSDRTVRLWEINTGRCLRVFEGHIHAVYSIDWNTDGQYALSSDGSDFAEDNTVRAWDTSTGACLAELSGHDGEILTVKWTSDQRHACSGDSTGTVRYWDLSDVLATAAGQRAARDASALDQVQYTNAKILIVGESGAGKTGLSKRLALNEWKPTDSTVGAWATQWKLPVSSMEGVEREIWLWDFGGQADQRLIHQLYMDDSAVAVLVFDGQKEDLFETLGQWDRDLSRASRKAAKILVAGRVDAGGLRASRTQIDAFIRERNYLKLVETSAKQNTGCDELRTAILDAIRWEDIPWRSSPLLFKRLKEEIVRLKDEGRVLFRFNELRETLHLRLADEAVRFTDDELKAVLSLLAGPGAVWELKFGSWVLLQPERINAYAQAVIRTMREDPFERGCLTEERVLGGDLTYQASAERLHSDEERFVLLAMHQTLLERGLCLREHTDKGALLIFPSYYRRERAELTGHPAVLASYRFNGFLDEIYATLVVKLSHTYPFEQDQLWRYAADFKTLMKRQLGVKLTRRVEGAGELEVYFEPSIAVEEKIIFSKYVHEHLLQNAKDVERLRHYVCGQCATPVANREVAMKRLEKGEKDIVCVNCEKRIPLWDEMEELFASADVKNRVRGLQEQAKIVLDNESKDRALVGDVISTVALAGQISREFTVSDHGIDMEIEFKSDFGEATGRKLYLQLKSGDSYLYRRKDDGLEIFTIKKERHAQYWIEQAFPVLLVIRKADGEVRWMEVRDWLKRATSNGETPVKQIPFEGERFDVMSVRRWRDKVLAES